MKRFLWETHMHTEESSLCGQMPAADIVRAYKNAGYHGVIITDHFVNGNSPGNMTAPWQRRMDILLRGYKAALEAGTALGIHVLLGWEYLHHGAEFLTYGLNESFLRDNPDLDRIGVDAYVLRVRAAGGFVSQAHPFRTATYLPPVVEKRWDLVDAFEVCNGSHLRAERAWDARALAMAKRRRLLMTAGSDAHTAVQVATAALSFAEPFATARDFLTVLRAGAGEVVRLGGLG